MTTSHLTLVPTTRLPRTEFGAPVLDDMDTPSDWWAMRADLDEQVPTAVQIGSLDYDALLPDALLGDVREPDLCDDGRAYWLTSQAVVSIDVTRIHEIADIVGKAHRIRVTGTEQSGRGWVRIAPSHYGIEVLSFHEHDGEPSAHSAQDAWTHLENAVR